MITALAIFVIGIEFLLLAILFVRILLFLNTP